MFRSHLSLIGIIGVLCAAAANGHAGVGDPTIRTDHPQYAGEGAFQTVEDCVRFATRGESTPQEQAISLYQWLLTHQWHLASPQEWCSPGEVPDTAKSNRSDLVVYDANRARFSYAYGLCGTVHAWNEPYWEALGMRARRRAFPGHVNSEVFYDGSWHAFDTDMAGLLFREDGVVAGYDDIIHNPELVDSVRPPLPHYPFDWPNDFNVMRRGWQQVAAGGNWYALYNSGYAAHPGIVHLRSGETFTRWYDRDHYDGPSKRRFWHHQPGGPRRNWTFFDNGTPYHDGADSNARGDATYANGEFIYVPHLAGLADEPTVSQTGSLAWRDDSLRLHASDGGNVSVTFSHFSPYVICGDPVDDANPMSSRATDGCVVEARLYGDVQVAVSADQGQTWHAVAVQAHEGTTRLDLTEQVKGRYGWHIRFSWSGEAGIDSLQFTTTTQVSQAIYPRLTPDGTEVTHRATSRAAVPVLPNFGLPESEADAFERVDMRSPNLAYRRRTAGSRIAYQTTDNKPAHLVFPVAAPGRLNEVRAAIQYSLRVPPPDNCDYHLDLSTDGGETWKTFATAEIPSDNEFSSGWLAGRAPVSEDISEALVRVHLYAGGHRTGLIDAQLYGIYDLYRPGPVTVELGWKENDKARSHAEPIPAGTTSHTFMVPTGSAVADRFVRLSCP